MRKRRATTRKQQVHPAQIRVMLHYMGVPIKDQPESAVGRKDLLAAVSNQEPEKYNEAYKIIVQGLNASDVVDHDVSPDQVLASEIARLSASVFEDEKIKAIDTVTNVANAKVNEFASDLAKHVRQLHDIAAKAIAEESKKFRKTEVKVGNKKAKKLDVVMPKSFDTVLELAAQRKNILMVGPAGCGKTFMAEKAAEAMDMDFSSQSCTSGMSESVLSGWLLPIGDSGSFVYVPSEFVRIYENGGVFLLDEIDAADPNVLVFINQALANGYFNLPQRYDNPLVKRHPDAVIMAAANTYGNGADMTYVGRNQLDAATLDRFRIGTVTMDYDENVERNLINEKVLTWGWNVRHQIYSNHLQRIMSTRAMIDATDMMENQGWDIPKIAKSYFADWSGDELRIMGSLTQSEEF